MFGLGKTQDLKDRIKTLEFREKTLEEIIEDKNRKMAQMEEDFERKEEISDELHEHELNKLDLEHAMDLERKTFQIDELPLVKEIREENEELRRQMEVLEKEVEMMNKVVNLNGDIIDIKELVANLIDKLPQVNISSLAVSNGTCK